MALWTICSRVYSNSFFFLLICSKHNLLFLPITNYVPLYIQTPITDFPKTFRKFMQLNNWMRFLFSFDEGYDVSVIEVNRNLILVFRRVCSLQCNKTTCQRKWYDLFRIPKVCLLGEFIIEWNGSHVGWPKQMDWMFTHLSVRLAPCGLTDIKKTVRHLGEQRESFKCSLFRDLLQRFELPRQYQQFWISLIFGCPNSSSSTKLYGRWFYFLFNFFAWINSADSLPFTMLYLKLWSYQKVSKKSKTTEN